jgi:hypothetical protein
VLIPTSISHHYDCVSHIIILQTNRFYINRSRPNRKNNRAVETEDPVVCALKYVAQIPAFLHAWPSPEEIGRVVGRGFDVPRGKKDELIPTLIQKHISSDPCTGPGVDMMGC